MLKPQDRTRAVVETLIQHYDVLRVMKPPQLREVYPSLHPSRVYEVIENAKLCRTMRRSPAAQRFVE
jgi:tryptophan 2,3-dioxygenase